MNENGWAEHKRLVEFRLNRNDSDHEKLFDKLGEMHKDLVEIKSQRKVLVASISAGVSGVVAIVLALAKAYLG